ncbi:transposase [Candidatus Woesearchaeota archaeon]|nr:transposase [Candidatus Woesearchaeota archaeon]
MRRTAHKSRSKKHKQNEISLSERTFKCLKCGFVCDRDLNASINHHDRAGLARISTPVGDTVRPLIKARVNEAGTIFRSST